MLEGESANPYSNLLVVELGERVAAGAAGSLLAQLGATVILVEPPRTGSRDKWRNRGIAAAGKRSIVIDRNSVDDRHLLKQIMQSADAVIASSDLDPDSLALIGEAGAAAPIICDITAFGRTGPFAGKPWSEHLVAALAGSIDTTGVPGSPPVPFGAQVLEMHAAVFATVGLLAALRVRRRQGYAQSVEIALFDVAVTGLLNFVALALGGEEPTRLGNRHPLYRPWGAYRAADGWIVICAASDKQWHKLCEVMQMDCLADDVRFATAQARMDNSEQLDEIVSSWAAGYSIAECEQRLVAAGVACGPILGLGDVAKERNIVHRKSIFSTKAPWNGQTVNVPRSPIRIGDSFPCAGRIPQPDQDRAEILENLVDGTPRWTQSSGPADDSVGPYDDITVVEIGQYTVAPMASRILASLGAHVIKVEPPRGDAIRKAPPLAIGGSYVFALSNTDKHGIVLDLHDEKDREILFRLLEKADMLVENLKPGSLAKLGVGEAELARRCPDLIVCAVSGFGADSAYPGRAALDTVIQAMSGLMSLTSVDGVPIKTGNSTSDMLGGEFGLLALQVGLDMREHGMRVPSLDVAMQDASIWATQYEWEPDAALDLPRVVSASDGFVAVDMARCSLDAQAVDRLEAQDLDRKTLAERLSGNADAAAPVLTVNEVLVHTQTIARDLLVERSTVNGQRWKVFSNVIRLSRSPVSVRSAMAGLGATDKYVLDNFL